MENNELIRLVLADDQIMIRQGLRYIIDLQPDMTVIAEVSDGEQAVQEAIQSRPDLVLMDIQMPKMTGIEATRAILQTCPGTKILLLTTFDVQEYVFDGIRAGAVGYLLKDLDMAELLQSIRLAAQGAAIYRSSTASQALAQAIGQPVLATSANPTVDSTADSGTDEANAKTSIKTNANLEEAAQTPQTPHPHPHFSLVDPLTDREIDVLQQMAYGKRNSDIAAILCVSEGTVKTHVHRILQKLGVEDRTQAVVLAIRAHIVQ